jgi:superfamily II DNA/RNA helicase
MKPFETLEEIGSRTAEAVVAQSGISHAGLAQHIRRLLVSGNANTGAILQEPVIEGAHPFIEAEETLGLLSGQMLQPELVDALDGASDQRPRNYVLKRSTHPFKHQLESWRQLIGPGEPQSVIVTSGTGSGKTECFLIPILNDLAKQAAHSSQPLEGVQAIMLYPLNALIESQKERFSEWIAPFGGRIRFGLYNGDTPSSARDADRRRTPEQVIDRAVLRANPPPILVTNPTMLEYMLVRDQDAPILKASSGKLKWIVLDEAHSLVGAAAAEIALLLRRVLLAFEVKSSDVHFVATSATIGEGEGVKKQLEIFLAEVAGIPNARVHMIEGHRRKPPRPVQRSAPDLPVDISSADPHDLYDALAGRDRVWSLVERLYAGTVPLKAFANIAAELKLQPTDLAIALSRARSRPQNGSAGDILAPLRIHAFQRAMPGLWSCVNGACPDAVTAWPFGRIMTERGEHCPLCAAPVLQIVSCTICGEPLLEGEERGGRLITPLSAPPVDEFRDDAEREKSGEEEVESAEVDDVSAHPSSLIGHRRLFAARPSKNSRPFFLERKTWIVADAQSESTLKLMSDEAGEKDPCPCCGEQSKWRNPLRPMRFGAPFLLGNSAPILLAGMSPEASGTEPLPSGGRRLLSFTDSRQGTARLAAKFEVEAERNFVRSVIYHSVQSLMQPAVGAEEQIKSINEIIKALETAGASAPGSPLRGVLDGKIAERSKLMTGNMDGIAWSSMVNRLAERIEVKNWIKEVWESRDPGEGRFSDATRLAEFLLLREFGRRPTRANSIETLGLAKLTCPAIDRLTDANVPDPFRRRGLSVVDWQDYLYVLLTHFVRANNAIVIDDWLKHWLLPKAPLRPLAGPDDGRGRKEGFVPWPSGVRLSLRSRPVLLLQKGLKLDLADAAELDDIDTCLRKAWDALRDPLTSSRSSERALAFEKAFVAPVKEAFWCPVTRRLLDRVAFGISPYSLGRAGRPAEAAERIELPSHPAPSVVGSDHESGRESIRAWLATDKRVAVLRERGGWRDLNDRIALFADYARSAEHSAQQDSQTLRTYEKAFKEGRINVLSCSTTMEMGVDIGAVESVMMTNVPPSIASYRQRVGRSGRRGQSLSLAFTFCKDRPLDREAFRDPGAYLTRKVAAPRVALNSAPIVQRHVNAYLLGAFLREHDGNAIAMTIGEFFGCPAALETGRQSAEDRASDNFLRWAERPEVKHRHSVAIAAIVDRSVLEGDRTLIDAALRRLRSVEQEFLTDWEGLRQLARDEGMRDAARTAMGFQLKRLCDEFLLGALADRGFLPGHGFPTHVVQFVTNSPAWRFPTADRSISGENRFRGRGSGPQRQLDLAIRDYAPGAEVVLDGLVYKSEGVTLNWKRPASVEGVKEVQGLLNQWSCTRCGAADIERGGVPEHCPVCASGGLKTSRFLRPGGFTVDFRATPHAEVDEVEYIPPEKPDVSTRDESWQSLPDPRLGRYRTSREGLVFYASRGASGGGYALCLECGRATAESADAEAELPRALVDHAPLRRRRDLATNVCPGNSKPFAIQRHLALGHEITTDVFELQPSAPLSEAAANALVIALREALAQELGIEASEMGCAVARRRNALGGQVFSLFLYDRAAGGGVFCSRRTANSERNRWSAEHSRLQDPRLRARLFSLRANFRCPRRARCAR